jgi:superfamily II DNA or RNA helicase
MSLFEEVLFDYQKVAAQRIADEKRLLLADQPGLGKTLEVLGGLEKVGLFTQVMGDILVLTPIINAHTTWIDSVERFVMGRYPNVRVIDLSKGSSDKKNKLVVEATKNPVVNVFVANHDALAVVKGKPRVPALFELVFDAVIVDESHLVLPIKNARKPTNFWSGLERLRYSSNPVRVAVSGTPDRGKLENRYGTWLFLDSRMVGYNQWAWLEEHFWVVEQRVSKTRTVKMVQGLKDEYSWVNADRAFMLRRTKAEVLPQLPPKRYVDVSIEMTDKQKAAYLVQQLDSTAKLKEARAEERNSGEAMVFALRARQIANCSWADNEPVVGGESAKLDWLIEWLAERGFIEFDEMADNKAKVVIVSQFSKILHWLNKELANVGIVSSVLDGSCNDRERVAIQDKFQNGDLRVILLSGGMGVGINLDAADDLIMMDSPYDPDRVEQIEDRVHRASSNHSVTIWNLVADDTLDEAIMERVSERYATTRKLLDGSRGVIFGREILKMVGGK